MRTHSTTGDHISSEAADGLIVTEGRFDLQTFSRDFLVFFPGSTAPSVAALPGRPVCGGVPHVRLIGTWPEHQQRIVRLGDTIVILLGQCLPDPSRIRAERRALVQDPDVAMTWPGSFVCLMVGPERVAAYTDLAAQFAVYHAQRGSQLIIGSDPRALATLHQRGPDALTAAARIACPDVLPLWEQRSPFDHIARVPGGSVVEADTQSLSVRRYADLRPDPEASRAECAKELGHSLVEAVGLRCMDGQVTCDLSGGLDSTSIAMLAARLSAEPLHAAVYHQPAAPAADLAEASRCARADPRIRLTVLTGGVGTLPYASAGDVVPGGWPISSEPWPGMLAWRRSVTRLAFAAARGSRHMTGEGGDAVLTAAPAHLADLAHLRTLPSLVLRCSAISRARETSKVRAAMRAFRLSRTAVGPALARLAQDLTAGRDGRSDWLDAISWWPAQPEAAGWLTARMRGRVAEMLGDRSTARAVPPGMGPADIAAVTALRNSAEAQRHLRELGQAYGVEVHAPFLDPAVIRAGLRLVAPLRADTASYKPLLRLALADKVPAAVFERTTKGSYSAEDYRGARRSGHVLQRLLDDSRLADLGVVEPTAVRASLARMRAGVAVPLGPLNHVLATEAWLRATLDTPGEQ